MSDEKLIHLCQTCIDFNNRVSGANSCAECWDKMKEKELGISDEEKVQILIKMDKNSYECIKNLDNLEEKEGIFPAIEAFNAFVEAVQEGKVKGDLEKTADVAENVDGWCNTCKHKHHKSKCIYCAKYDEHDNLIALSNYESED